MILLLILLLYLLLYLLLVKETMATTMKTQYAIHWNDLFNYSDRYIGCRLILA